MNFSLLLVFTENAFRKQRCLFLFHLFCSRQKRVPICMFFGLVVKPVRTLIPLSDSFKSVYKKLLFINSTGYVIMPVSLLGVMSNVNESFTQLKIDSHAWSLKNNMPYRSLVQFFHKQVHSINSQTRFILIQSLSGSKGCVCFIFPTIQKILHNQHLKYCSLYSI